MVGTRGSFFGNLGDETSFAGFCCTTPSLASHLYIDRNAASALATETLLSPCECSDDRKPRRNTWSISFQRISGPRYSAKRLNSFWYARSVCTDACRSPRKCSRNLAMPFLISALAAGRLDCSGGLTFIVHPPPSSCLVDDICDTRSLAGPAQRAYKPAWLIRPHGRGLSARCASPRHFLPYAWHNYGEAYADWHVCHHPPPTPIPPSATRAAL